MVLFLAGASLCIGCAEWEGASLRLEGVAVVEGTLTERQFTVRLWGRGFGLQRVSYNVRNGQGTGVAAPYTIELAAAGTAVTPAQMVTIESPRSLRVRVSLITALPPGLYTVYLRQEGARVAALPAALAVGDGALDGGARPDGGGPDAAAGAGAPDAGAPDADVPDAGPPDAGAPDSGLGPFAVDAPYRRAILAPHAVAWPAGATIVVPVDHARLVTAGKSRPGAEDFRVTQGGTQLPFQLADRLALQTSDLRLVVRLARDVPAGGDPSAPLALYYGDLTERRSAATDGVFALVERFADIVSPYDPDEAEASWFAAEGWVLAPHDRPRVTPMVTEGAYGVRDLRGAPLLRQTLASPRIDGIRVATARPPNTRYAMQLWLFGRMTDGDADILYLSHLDSNGSPAALGGIGEFHLTRTFPADGFDGYPLSTLTFEDSDGAPRTVRGWRLPTTLLPRWARVGLRFEPELDRPSLHLRYVSTAPEGTTDQSVTMVDDWWVRLAVEPEPEVQLGPEQPR